MALYKLRSAAINQLLKDARFEALPELIAQFKDDSRKSVQQILQRAEHRYEKEKGERERVEAMYALSNSYSKGVVVGIDEVGRGPLAGPLSVCAVILPKEPYIWGLNDSKKLSSARREELAVSISEHALAISLIHIGPEIIDQLGMGQALRMAMSQALDALGHDFDKVLIDGNSLGIDPRETCIVGGDGKIAQIAAASIVAKVARDAYMMQQDSLYPEYGFAQHKGYGSAAHIENIKSFGLCPLHRRSFCRNFIES